MLRALISLTLITAAVLPSAQISVKEDDYHLNVNVELVQLPVSVVDKQGLPVRGLQPEHFEVYEDKVLQQISLFQAEDTPLSVVIVVDTSSSMADKLKSLNTAAMTFVRESNPEDETAILSFGDGVRINQDFTTNTNRVNSALEGITPFGNTALYDAVLAAAQYFNDHASRQKGALLVISDGEDNHSHHKLAEALRTIQESKVTLYSIGLLGADPGFAGGGIWGSFGDAGNRALSRLSEATGGAAFFPKGIRNVEEMCKRIAHDLRYQYTIGYKPSNEKLDGSWRKTLVRVHPPRNTPRFKVRAKPGYYAPIAKEAAETHHHQP
jgi:Ca-activated chloride channel homolog